MKVSETRWERLLPDGSKEVYSALGSAETFWLSEVVDPAGNALTLQYDSDYRLSTITDALGQKTTFLYSEPGDIYKVSEVIDPFGRRGQLQLQRERPAYYDYRCHRPRSRTLPMGAETS